MEPTRRAKPGLGAAAGGASDVTIDLTTAAGAAAAGGCGGSGGRGSGGSCGGDSDGRRSG